LDKPVTITDSITSEVIQTLNKMYSGHLQKVSQHSLLKNAQFSYH